jgi:hypothetical protein
MPAHDFRTVAPGTALPLVESDFIFAVTGVSSADVGPRGIHCGPAAILQLTVPVNSLELEVLNGAPASIRAFFYGPKGWTEGVGSPKQIFSDPNVETIRFDFAGIQRITFEGAELYLQLMR